jgi:hypothetical protein
MGMKPCKLNSEEAAVEAAAPELLRVAQRAFPLPLHTPHAPFSLSLWAGQQSCRRFTRCTTLSRPHDAVVDGKDETAFFVGVGVT